MQYISIPPINKVVLSRSGPNRGRLDFLNWRQFGNVTLHRDLNRRVSFNTDFCRFLKMLQQIWSEFIIRSHTGSLENVNCFVATDKFRCGKNQFTEFECRVKIHIPIKISIRNLDFIKDLMKRGKMNQRGFTVFLTSSSRFKTSCIAFTRRVANFTCLSKSVRLT